LESKKSIILDLNGIITPLALLKVTEAFRKMKKGDILEILTEANETRNDIFKVLNASSYEIIEISETESVYRILLNKK
jgi:TusA-related sulfurtransferase